MSDLDALKKALQERGVALMTAEISYQRYEEQCRKYYDSSRKQNETEAKNIGMESIKAERARTDFNQKHQSVIDDFSSVRQRLSTTTVSLTTDPLPGADFKALLNQEAEKWKICAQTLKSGADALERDKNKHDQNTKAINCSDPNPQGANQSNANGG